MKVETNDSRAIIRQSLMNFRKNASIVALLLVLTAAVVAIKAPHNEMIWTVLLIFVIKAESRPQPIPVVLLAVATTITSIAVLSPITGGLAISARVLTIVLLVPLIFSKWFFSGKDCVVGEKSP